MPQSSEVVTLYDTAGNPHQIMVRYVEAGLGRPALKFDRPSNSMYFGGP